MPKPPKARQSILDRSEETYRRNFEAVAAGRSRLLAVLRELIDSPNAKSNDLWDRARAAVADADDEFPAG
jgi:hypothetical protein